MENGLDRLTDMARGFAVSRLLLTAVELEVFTRLGRGPASRARLQEELGLHPRGAGAFLDALVAHGLLERSGELYTNSPLAARHLDREGAEEYIGGYLVLTSGLYWLWPALPHSLATGRPCTGMPGAEEAEDGEGAQEAPTEWSPAYVDAMAVMGRRAAHGIAAALDWTRMDTFVDVGGSAGTLARELVRCHPHLRGVCFDLPQLREAFDGASGDGDGVTFAAGDFFQDPIPQADAAVLGRILHNWSPEERADLLKRVCAAVRPGGAVLVFDQLVQEDPENGRHALLSSLDQLLFSEGGGEYSFAELCGWLDAAGFRDPVCVPLNGGPERLVVARRP